METSRTIIISLGGSLIVPESIDTEFLGAFRDFVTQNVSQNIRFVLITGGGRICRNYQDALKSLGNPTNDELDWMGIATTHTNAMLVKLLFKDLAAEQIIVDPTQVTELTAPVTIGGGWKPGWSTDYDAIELAVRTGARQVINLSNIDYAYDSDPKKNPNARRFENISWAEYRSYIPETWDAGLSTPFDPIASKRAEESGIEVAIMNGKNIANIQNYINGEHFIGTVIK